MLDTKELSYGLRDLQREIHKTATDKGWWDNPREEGTLISLMHCELSEAVEGLRAGNPKDDKIPEYYSCEAELADVIIRIFDFAEGKGHDVIGAMMEKVKMNKGREHMHGGKKF